MPTPKKCKHTIFDKQCDYCAFLKAKWYGKLGNFNGNDLGDIEKDEDYLKSYSSDTFRPKYINTQAGGWQAKAEYYSLASKFLNEYKFEREIDKVIWEYHAEGLSIPDIVKTFTKLRFKKWANRNDITAVLKGLKVKMFDMYLAPVKEYRE